MHLKCIVFRFYKFEYILACSSVLIALRFFMSLSRGVDSHPPSGYLCYFQNTTGPTQPMHNGSSPQPVNAGDDTNGGDCGRTEKRLLWTKQEDLRLVCLFLHSCWLHVFHY